MVASIACDFNCWPGHFLFYKMDFEKLCIHRHIIKLKGIHIGLERRFYFYPQVKKKKSFYFAFYIYLDHVPDGDICRIPGAFCHRRTWTGSGFQRTFACNTCNDSCPGRHWRISGGRAAGVIIYSIDNISFGWLMWSVTTGIIIVVGLISFGLLIYTNKKSNEAKQQNS